MARDLELNVKGESKDAQAALAAAAREMDRAARDADKLGRAFDAAKRDAEQLDRELVKNAAAVKLLAKEYAAADGEARDGIKKRLDAERAAGNETRRIRKEIIGDTERDSKAATTAFVAAAKQWDKLAGKAEKDARSTLGPALEKVALDAAKAGEESASAFADGFTGLLKNPAILGIGASLAALLTIPIGAGIGGLTLAGAGLGAAGLAGFAASKADNSGQVSAAGKGLTGDLNRQVLAGGKDAIGPLVAGINELRSAVKDIHLDQIIRDGAKYIVPLAAGAAQFARFLGEAAQKLTESAGPEIQVLADELPDLGRAFLSAANDIGGGAGGGAKALKDLLDVIEGVIIGTGKFIGLMEGAYGAIHDFGNGILTATEGWGKFVPGVNSALLLLDLFGKNADSATEKIAHTLNTVSTSGNAAAASAAGFTLLNQAVYNTADAADAANAAFDRLFNETINLDQANLAAEAGFRTMAETIKRNKGALDEHSAAGIADRQAILAQVQVLEQQRQAAIAAGDGTLEGTRKANGAFLQQLQRLREVAAAAGADTSQLDALINKYKALANAPDVSKSITITTTYRTNGTPQQGHSRYPTGTGGFAHGGVRYAADGMIVPPSNPGTVIFGEPSTGGELFLPLKGAHDPAGLVNTAAAAYGLAVIPTRQRAAAAAMRWTGNSGASRSVATSYTPQGLEALFMSWFLKQVQEGTLPLALA